MGCNCTNNRKQNTEIFTPPPAKQSSLLKAQSTNPKTLQSLKVDQPFSHCNILVWTETLDEFNTLFPNSYVKVTCAQNTSMSFSIISLHSERKINLVVDCLIYIAKSDKDIPVIKEISENHQNICIQIVVTPVKLTGIPRIIPIFNLDQLYQVLFDQQANLEKLLRNIFCGMDENFDNVITILELGKALKELEQNLSPDSIVKVMEQIDFDKDGKISFNEFTY